MSENQMALLATIAPAAFILSAVTSWFESGQKPFWVKRISTLVSIIAMVSALLCGLLVIDKGLLETDFIGMYDFGFSLRLDSLSVLMFGMIALLGFIIIKFSDNYLDGDQRQGAFIGRLSATIASVMLLVLSGNLGILLVSWVLTSISLHRLLVFYADRPGAQSAARKKFILARLSDVSLVTAIVMIYHAYGTGNLEVIFSVIKKASLSELPFMAIEGPAIFLVLAALLKSAQFPTHGWLIEVMETPTPVSALLHAGLLNAGPFLIIRMAHLMDASSIGPIILMSIGGLTALIGSVAYLTQTSVKTALGYSSIAHMGFSLMVSGLGVYSAAMLHLVAHSFYKAHAFLSSGSVIDVLKASKVAKATRSMHPVKMALGILVALVLYTGFALLWGIDPAKDLSLLIIGAIIIMGLSRLLSSAIDSNGSKGLIFHSSLMALAVTAAFFVLESATHYLLGAQLPVMALPGTAKLIASSIILLIFTLAVVAQIFAPRLTHKANYLAFSIHVRNGFYANALFDRAIRALYIPSEEVKLVDREYKTQKIKFESSEKISYKEQLA